MLALFDMTVLTDVYCSKQPTAVATGLFITHFLVSGIGQKKPFTVPKFVAAQKMLAKQKPKSKHS